MVFGSKGCFPNEGLFLQTRKINGCLNRIKGNRRQTSNIMVIFLQETAPSVINWQDYEGRTALHLAVADGNEAVCDALVSN
jgi:ankyrin repeat protein